jgi:hypothetical protein
MPRWLLTLLAATLAGCGSAPAAEHARTPRDPDKCSTLWNREASAAAARAELGALAASVDEQPVFSGLAGPALGSAQVCFMVYGDGHTETLWAYARDGWKRLPHPRDSALRQVRAAVYNASSGRARRDGTVRTF